MCLACILFSFVIFGFGIVLSAQQLLIIFIPLILLSIYPTVLIFRKLKQRCDKNGCSIEVSKMKDVVLAVKEIVLGVVHLVKALAKLAVAVVKAVIGLVRPKPVV